MSSRTVELDIRGLVCPQTGAVVRRALAELDPGEALLVTGDYPPAARSIRRSCYKHGYRVAEESAGGAAGDGESDGEFTLRITVTEEGTLVGNRDERAVDP
jgi:tRNA 2-thiouridine synthesizing protein A